MSLRNKLSKIFRNTDTGTSVPETTATDLDYIAVGNETNPKHIILMLHGRGGNNQQMRQVAEIFLQSLPQDVLVIIPNGPVSLASLYSPTALEALKRANPKLNMETARTWLGPPRKAPRNDRERNEATAEIISAATSAVSKLANEQLEKYNLSGKNLTVYGFSEGGTIALLAGLSIEPGCGAVISHSGPLTFQIEGANAKPDTLLIAGEQEAKNPLYNLYHASTAQTLKKLGCEVEEKIVPKIGHAVTAEGMALAVEYIAAHITANAAAPQKKPGTTKPGTP